MKKITFIALFVLSAISASAQNSKLIVGKWAYSDLYDKSTIDEEGQMMATMLFKEMTVSFGADNVISLTMRKKPEPGKYSFDPKDDKIINAVSDTGKKITLTIIKLTENELIVTLDKMGSMIFKKVSGEPDAIPAPTPKVPATAKQITGKWYVTGSDGKKLSEMAADLMSDSFVNFAADGKYHAKILAIEQKGTWKFGEGNTTILVETEDGKGIWSIYKISDSELVMQNDTSVKHMMFSKTQPK